VRREADEAVRFFGWKGGYHVDADHIRFKTVDLFLEPCDYFTLDVADLIGRAADAASTGTFTARCMRYAGRLRIPGIGSPFEVTEDLIHAAAGTYLAAVQEAGRIHRKIEAAKGREGFITEVSMDETGLPQTPVELFFILAAIAGEGIPVQTIAPRFPGAFHKGVDHAGDKERFFKEFEEDLCVAAFAAEEFGLPGDLKLSMHSGSDKFSLYPGINRLIKKHGAGLHLKTAGTTWLEEVIGLAEAGGEGLGIAKEIYRNTLGRIGELRGPYAAVVDIDPSKLPGAREIEAWSGADFAAVLRHDPSSPRYNPHFRQMLHVSYKVAAEMGKRYTDAIDRYESVIADNVTGNLYERHQKPLFM
jgi:hypothetical protein